MRDSVVDAIRAGIRTGRLAPGTRLPSSRALAVDLGVARNTVARAYAELIAEGWLSSQHGSATRVSHRAAGVVQSVAAPQARTAPRRLEHELTTRPSGSVVVSRAEWSRAVKRALSVAPFEAFGYADPHGRPELRRALAQYLARARGVRSRPCNIVICSRGGRGTQPRRRCTGGHRGHLRRRRGIRPSNPESITRQGRIACPPISVDAYGADVATLDDMPDVGGVLLTPSHQFPLGVSLRSDRRAAVIDWARRSGG